MIRFVDLCDFYWSGPDDDPADQLPRLCAFVNTVNCRFIEHDGEHVFCHMEDINEADPSGRLASLVPEDFFDLSKPRLRVADD